MPEVERTSEGCPEGWTRIVTQRTGGSSAGLYDLKFLTPSGERLRSRAEIVSYLTKSGDPDLINQFDFSKPKPERRQLSTSVNQSSPDSTPAKRGRKSGKKSISAIDVDDSESGTTAKKKRGPKPKKSRASAASSGDSEEFLLEHYTDDIWRFMIAAFFLEQNGKDEDDRLKAVLEAFFDVFPDPHTLQQNWNWMKLQDWLKAKKFDGGEQFAQAIARYTFDIMFDEEKGNPQKLHGVSAFIHCCHRIFMLRDMSAPTQFGPRLMDYKRRIRRLEALQRS